MYKLVSKGTVDQEVYKLASNKRQKTEALLDMNGGKDSGEAERWVGDQTRPPTCACGKAGGLLPKRDRLLVSLQRVGGRHSHRPPSKTGPRLHCPFLIHLADPFPS